MKILCALLLVGCGAPEVCNDYGRRGSPEECSCDAIGQHRDGGEVCVEVCAADRGQQVCGWVELSAR
jgi:hypothetical protein